MQQVLIGQYGSSKTTVNEDNIRNFGTFMTGIFTIELVKDGTSSVCYCKSYLVIIDSISNPQVWCYDTLMFPWSSSVPVGEPAWKYEWIKWDKNTPYYGVVDNPVITLNWFTEKNQGFYGYISNDFYALNEAKIRVCYVFSGEVTVIFNIPDYSTKYPSGFLAYAIDKSCNKNERVLGPLILRRSHIISITPLNQHQIKRFGLEKLPIKHIRDTTAG